MREIPLDIAEDVSRPYGYARAVFAVPLDVSGTVNVRIVRRSADLPYLGANGWQAGPTAMPATVADVSGESTTLLLGPDICDRMPLDLQVRVEVEAADVCGRAFWPAVQPTPQTGSSGLRKEHRAPPPPPEKRSLPEEDVVDEEAPEEAAPAGIPTETPARRRRWSLVLLPALIVLAGLAAAYYYRPGLMAMLKPAPHQKTLAERFDDLRKAGADGPELFALGKEAYAAGNTDIGFRATDLASQRGNVDAKLEIARWYDPRSFDATKFPHPDANNAALYYSQLPDNEKARNLLSSLCAEAANPSSPYYDDFQNFLSSSYCPANAGN
jgi:hypothetical protein